MTIIVVAATLTAALVAVAAIYGRRVKGDSIRQTGEGEWEMELE
jgi:hypothetical protein